MDYEKFIINAKRNCHYRGRERRWKKTFARVFLQEYDYEFLNADEIAKSLSAQNPSEKKISAGKLFLQKLNEMVSQNKSLLIESTLSGKYLQKFIENAR